MKSFLLTLVSPAGNELAAELPPRIAAALAAAGAEPGEGGWLEPGRAWDLPFARLEPSAAAEATARELGEVAVDFAVQPAEGRRKRLLLADMESTVIGNEMLDELAAAVGAGEEVAAITASAMNGELDFAEALRRRVGLLAGRPASLLEEMLGEIRVDPGAETLTATMRAHGARTVIATGGFGAFAGPVARCLGFDAYRANELEIEGGVLTGEAAEPILDRGAKLRALREECATLGIEPAEAVAVGDGANDLDMLRAAGLGVAYHAKPIVAAEVPSRVAHGDLSTLLYFQGYHAHEICRGSEAAPIG